MKKIGEGLQYTVYDLGNGRTFKKPTNVLQRCCRVLAWRFPFLETPIWTIPRDILRVRADARRSLGGLRPLLPFISLELGSPTINDDFSYEQDRAVVVTDYFRTHSLASNKRVIDEYVALLFRFWEHGFTERAFKILMNFGVTADDRLILLDLGELYFEKETARQRIRACPWEGALILDAVLNEYYRAAMRSAMTVENLEAYWGRALNASQAGSDPVLETMPSLAISP